MTSKKSEQQAQRFVNSQVVLTCKMWLESLLSNQLLINNLLILLVDQLKIVSWSKFKICNLKLYIWKYYFLTMLLM